jgi:hypothetical protein
MCVAQPSASQHGREPNMDRRTKAILATLGAVAAIGAGSAALASASGAEKTSTDKPDQGETVHDQPGADVERNDAEHGSEIAGGDGPTGHADEPANPNAHHEAQGAE